MSRNTSKLGLVTLAVGSLAVGPAWAKSGADLLLKGFKGKLPQQSADTGAESVNLADAPSSQDAGLGSVSQFKLNDPITVQFFSTWNDQRSDLNPELNRWAMLFLKGDFEQVLHLWDSIENRIPTSFRSAARAAQLTSMVRIGLIQSAVEQWVDLLSLSTTGAVNDKWTSVLESTLPRWLAGGDNAAATWDQVLLERGVILSPEIQNDVMRLNASKRISAVSLQAYASLRKGEQGRKLLPLLRPENQLKLPLAQTVALALARKGDLASAATTLKTHAEPALEAQKDLSKVSGYLLQIARFLFQAGMWEEAEGYLRKIPTSSPEFLNSREELAWILLRKGDVSVLRGEVASLSAVGLDSQFRPELPVVRAISNLKLCSYGAVQKDFADFQAANGIWAKKIDQALTSVETPAPVEKDSFSRLAELRVSALGREVAKIGEMHARSLKTGTPSVVGRQSQWKRLEVAIRGREELAKKLLRAEYNRQWRNQKALLAEAIRKMRFVKVELLHQMHQAAADAEKGMDVISSVQAAPVGEVVFPLDGVLWPDELFKIQAQVENRCLRSLKEAR